MNAEVGREQLLAEREELARTVQALAERFDVGARARAAAGSARVRGLRAFDRVVRSDLFVLAAAVVGAAVVLAVSGRWWRTGSQWRRASERAQQRS